MGGISEVVESSSRAARIGGILRRPAIACLLVFLLAITLRLALLRVIPIPVPIVQDEFSYLLGGETLASGRLTNPAHPMWVHFETFHVNITPTYCSKYPPAQALFLAFGQSVFGHPWFGVLISMALMFAAVCWALEGWISRPFALLTSVLAILEWGLATYWIDSYWGGAPSALGGALVIGAVPRLARKIETSTVLLASLGAIVLANSRPYEGGLTVLTSAALLLWWRRREKQRVAGLFSARAIVPAMLVALPCIAAMGFYNYRLTGSPTLLPYVVNERMYASSPRFFFSKDVTVPTYRHENLRRLWEWDRGMYLDAKANPLANFGFSGKFVGPFYVMTMLTLAAVIGLLAGRRPESRYAAIILGVTIAGIFIEKAFLPHYFGPVHAVFLVLAAVGLERMWRFRRILAIAFVGISIATCISDIREEARNQAHGPLIVLRPKIIRELEAQGGKHLVIVHYSPTHYIHAEWIYNHADIDGSSVVWAQDMGAAKNQELVDYYRDRKVWLLEPDKQPVQPVPYTR